MPFFQRVHALALTACAYIGAWSLEICSRSQAKHAIGVRLKTKLSTQAVELSSLHVSAFAPGLSLGPKGRTVASAAAQPAAGWQPTPPT